MFKEFAVTVVSFGNEMKLGYPQRLTLNGDNAHGDNDGKTDGEIKSRAELTGEAGCESGGRKEKGEEGKKLSSGGGLLAIETGGACGGRRGG